MPRLRTDSTGAIEADWTVSWSAGSWWRRRRGTHHMNSVCFCILWLCDYRYLHLRVLALRSSLRLYLRQAKGHSLQEIELLCTNDCKMNWYNRLGLVFSEHCCIVVSQLVQSMIQHQPMAALFYLCLLINVFYPRSTKYVSKMCICLNVNTLVLFPYSGHATASIYCTYPRHGWLIRYQDMPPKQN